MNIRAARSTEISGIEVGENKKAWRAARHLFRVLALV
jgi:hypothetical protein